MNAIFFLMGQFDCKLTLTLDEVCRAIGYAKQTGYNEIGAGTFPIPMQNRLIGSAGFLGKLEQN